MSACTIFIVLLLYPNFAVQATYLSLHEQFRLVDREAELIKILQKYTEAEKTRLDKLEKFQNAVIKNIELYKSVDELAWNPLGIFKTVKHLIPDFEDAKRTMMENNHNDTIAKVSLKKAVLPDEDNLYQAIQNLLNLQQKSNITVLDFINGRLKPDQNVQPLLTIKDCFIIGKTSAEKQDHETAVNWLLECNDAFDEETKNQAANILIESTLFMNNKASCRQAVNRCLRLDPTSRKLQDLQVKLGLDLGNWQWDTEMDQYESFRTCVGDYEHDLLFRKLKCRYNHHNSPFLAIAPLKEEVLSLTPKVSIFREAIYDSEIEMLKANAFHLFRTATVLKDSEGRRAADLNYRPSQTAFIDSLQPQYMKLRERLQDISSLSLKYAESFQMLHYAPGGFYRVHADYLYSTPDVQQQGNRIATALMYLSDATLGGSTVFPRQRMAVQPIKGSILFWVNMRVDGSEENMNRHAACPVIFGEKIACTQWFRIKGQDHWFAEPDDDMEGKFSVNPNFICPRKTTHRISNPLG